MRGTDGILIATLGTKAQVVTTAIDLLLAEGHVLRDVSVLYPASVDESDPLAPALNSLRLEFDSYPLYQSLNLQLIPLMGPSFRPDNGVSSSAEADAAFRGVYHVIWAAKRAEPGRPIHLSIVGGRKFLAVYGMAAAQLLFDDDDRAWYVLVADPFLSEQRLHPRPNDEVRLVAVPVLRWGTLSPILTDLREIDDPFAAVERQRAARISETLDEARSFILGALTTAERRIVASLVTEGATDAHIAERLNISRSTVGTHLEHVFRKARNHWDLREVNRSQLVSLLNMYFALNA